MSASEAVLAVSTELVRQALKSGATVEARVESGSMHPLILTGDVVSIVSTCPETLAKGDIVVYNAGNTLAVHRVVAFLRFRDGKRGLVTKGDANGTADPPIMIEEVAGVIVRISSGAGRTIELTGFWARGMGRLIAVLSSWSGTIWGYRSEPCRGVTGRAGKILIKPVGAVIRRVYAFLDRVVAKLC